MNILLYLGCGLTLLAVLTKQFNQYVCGFPLSVILLAIGALLSTIYFSFNPIKSDDKQRSRRLQLQMFISLALMWGSAYLLYIKDPNWLLTLLIADVILILITYRNK